MSGFQTLKLFKKLLFKAFKDKKTAFTLAEILIALGIIGIVAALTIPTLVNKYKYKVLETQFKSLYSELLQVNQSLIYEYGGYTNFEDTKNFFVSKYNKSHDAKAYSYKDFKTYNLSKSDAVIHYNCLWNNLGDNTKRFVLTNGAEIGICQRNSETIITADTNGKNKGPNAFGHDIFFFKINNMGKVVSENWLTVNCAEGDTDEHCKTYSYRYENATCTRSKNSNTNGVSCASFAISNICPDNNSKNYWECLPQ